MALTFISESVAVKLSEIVAVERVGSDVSLVYVEGASFRSTYSYDEIISAINKEEEKEKAKAVSVTSPAQFAG